MTRAKPPTRTEASVLAGCLRLLKLRGVPAWRNNTGAVKTDGRFLRFGSKGSSDILGLVPRSGRFLAIECKRPGGKPTADQAAFLEAVRAAGGVAVVADDEGALAGVLDALARDPWAEVTQ